MTATVTLRRIECGELKTWGPDDEIDCFAFGTCGRWENYGGAGAGGFVTWADCVYRRRQVLVFYCEGRGEAKAEREFQNGYDVDGGGGFALRAVWRNDRGFLDATLVPGNCAESFKARKCPSITWCRSRLWRCAWRARRGARKACPPWRYQARRPYTSRLLRAARLVRCSCELRTMGVRTFLPFAFLRKQTGDHPTHPLRL
jgi:hypothetical protein